MGGWGRGGGGRRDVCVCVYVGGRGRRDMDVCVGWGGI